MGRGGGGGAGAAHRRFRAGLDGSMEPGASGHMGALDGAVPARSARQAPPHARAHPRKTREDDRSMEGGAEMTEAEEADGCVARSRASRGVCLDMGPE